MSEHRFVTFTDGFRIEAPERCPVTVRLQPWFLAVSADAHDVDEFPLLCKLPEFAHHLSGMLICPWSRLPKRRSGVFEREAWTITPALHEQLERLRAMVDPQVLAVHRAMFDMLHTVPRVAQSEAFYREPFLARDVLTYRAAAVALAYLESDLWENSRASAPHETAEPTLELLVQAMHDWRGLYSPDGRPYRSLNRTLMNLPLEPPAKLLFHLREVRLARPITDALHLTTLLLHVAHPAANPEVNANQIEILQHASATEIRAAVAHVAACTRRTLAADREEDLRFVLRYLGDYPEGHRGRLGGLVDKAVRWHHDIPYREAVPVPIAVARMLPAGLKASQPTAMPPVPLPKFPGITFLRTAGAVAAEGLRMGHCIASYAGKAAAGGSYLFHVEHNGEMASVEVSPKGVVEQSSGPRNALNSAAVWGRQKLAAWAFQLRPPPRPPRRRIRHAAPGQLAFPFFDPGSHAQA
jgi:hypothetical protein